MALCHLLLPLLLVTLLSTTSSASHHHSPAATTTTSSSHHHHHHHPPSPPASAELSQSLLVLDPIAAASQPLPTEADGMAAAAAAAAAQPSLLFPTQIAPPPPSFLAAPDLSFQPSPPQPQGAAASSSSTTTTTTLPLPNQAAAGAGGAEVEQTLQQLARVLASLGYQEMASAAPLVADSPVLAAWPGPITVFAASDATVLASCSSCSRRNLLLEHITPGLYPLASLSTLPTATKLPSASMGFCLTLSSTPSPFPSHPAKLFVDGAEISRPELYNDGRFVVHGLQGFIPPLSLTSCFHGPSPASQLAARSANAAAAAGAVVRIMLRDAIVRLRDAGYGFVALALRIKFTELERLGNMTVFALDDQAVFAGGGHAYVSDVRFHVVPGRVLTHADLLRLPPGSVLHTLAGAGQSLVVTHGAGSGSGVRINYVPIKAPDAVLNSRVAVHGVFLPFPHLYLAELAASVAAISAARVNGTCGMGAPFSDCASSAAGATATPIPVSLVGGGQ